MSDVELIPPDQILGESDWEDQDLLTIDDARVRLQEELAACLQSLGAQGLSSDASAAEADRVKVLRRRLVELERGPTPLA